MKRKPTPQILDLVEFYRYLEMKFYREIATDDECEQLQAASLELQAAGVAI